MLTGDPANLTDMVIKACRIAFDEGVVKPRGGILITAGESRHGTATSTFLISPDRRRVIAAKLVAASLVGAAVAVVAALLPLAIGLHLNGIVVAVPLSAPSQPVVG